MSILGIAHTVISIVALVVAVVSLSKDGAINPFSKLGKQYSILTATLKVLLVLYLTGLTIQIFRLKMMLKQK